MAATDSAPASNFIRNIIAEDMKTNKWGSRVHAVNGVTHYFTQKIENTVQVMKI